MWFTTGDGQPSFGIGVGPTCWPQCGLLSSYARLSFVDTWSADGRPVPRIPAEKCTSRCRLNAITCLGDASMFRGAADLTSGLLDGHPHRRRSP